MTSFNDGDLVLTKVKGFPLWPSRIIPADKVPESINSIRRKAEQSICVKFFADDNYVWANEKELQHLGSDAIEAFLVKKGEAENKTFKPKRKNALVQAYLIAKMDLPVDEFIEYGSFGKPEEPVVEEEEVKEEEGDGNGELEENQQDKKEVKKPGRKKKADSGPPKEKKTPGRKRKTDSDKETTTSKKVKKEKETDKDVTKTKGRGKGKGKGKGKAIEDEENTEDSAKQTKKSKIKKEKESSTETVPVVEEEEEEDSDWGLDDDSLSSNSQMQIPNSAELIKDIEIANKVSTEFRIFLQSSLLINKENSLIALSELDKAEIESIETKIKSFIAKYPTILIPKISLKNSNIIKVIVSVLKRPDIYTITSFTNIKNILLNFIQSNYYTSNETDLILKLNIYDFLNDKIYKGDLLSNDEESEADANNTNATVDQVKDQTPIAA